MNERGLNSRPCRRLPRASTYCQRGSSSTDVPTYMTGLVRISRTKVSYHKFGVLARPPYCSGENVTFGPPLRRPLRWTTSSCDLTPRTSLSAPKENAAREVDQKA